MDLDNRQVDIISQSVKELTGQMAQVSLLQIDESSSNSLHIFVELPYPLDAPGLLKSRISGRASYRLGGVNVEVSLSAPNYVCSSVVDFPVSKILLIS